MIIAGHEPLPKTLTAQTGNQGTHYYFKHPKDGNKYGNKSYSEKVWPYQGVDIRVMGICGRSPSVVKEKPYRWINRARIAPCPPWLLEVINMNQSFIREILLKRHQLSKENMNSTAIVSSI